MYGVGRINKFCSLELDEKTYVLCWLNFIRVNGVGGF